MLRVKNFVPAISLEGFEDANDSRRGQGVYEKVMHAMDLLKAPTTWLSVSLYATPAAILRMYPARPSMTRSSIREPCLYGSSHYMPVGNDASVDLAAETGAERGNVPQNP